MSDPASGLPPPEAVVERALAAAGGGGCLVVVEESHQAEVRFANNTTTTNGVRVDRRVMVVRTVEVGGGVAAGVARRAGDADVAEMVVAAAADAAASSPAGDAAPLVEGDAEPGFAGAAPRADLGALAGVLSSLSGAFARAEKSGRVLSGFAEQAVGTTWLGSSTGLRRRHVQPAGTVQLVGRSAGGTRSAWAAEAAADLTGTGVGPLEERVARGLEHAARRIDVPAGRHEVVLPPEAVADLMVFLVASAGGQEAAEGRTVFSRAGGGTRVGEVLSALPLELWSDPAQPGLEGAPFVTAGASGPDVSVFDNGMAVGRTSWIGGGRLGHLAYHRAGAARAGAEPAPPPGNLLLELPGATGTVDDLVARTEHGLLLTCLWYIREVDPATLLLTGLTRDGVYVVEDGAVVGAANNFRFNESPVDLLSRATEAGGTVRALGRELGEWMSRTAMPALRVPDFNMSSVSTAS